MIQSNLDQIEETMNAACVRAGRKREEITLIAVSKQNSVEKMKEAIDCGLTEFGENKVQELTDKMEQLPSTLNWHMIGHLQRNKVKYIVDKVCLIHSVDSYRLAEQIDAEAAKKSVICHILLEVNVAEEDSKFGAQTADVMELVEQISKLRNIQLQGLMTIAPYVENPEENRTYFRKLRKLYIDIKSKNIDNVVMDTLSMGMTGDYEIAIEEGATMIRVGTGIFGERNYNTRPVR